MQIWIFFGPGAGGDGFANLLEHASGVTPIDGMSTWRIHRYVDGEPKFWMPAPDRDLCFRSGRRFDSKQNQLLESYIKSVDGCAIVASHDTSLVALNNSDCLDVLTRDQIKILIKSRNIKEDSLKFAKKNLQELSLNQIELMYPDVDINAFFDHAVFLDEIMQTWSSFQSFLKSIGLEMEQEFFEDFRKIVRGEIVYVTPGIRHFTSRWTNERLSYLDVTDNLQVPEDRRRVHVWPETE